jgi:SAM-dependent methyltransferase
MVHHKVCPVCSSENTVLHFSCTDFFISREAFELFTCQSCGFIFTQKYPDQSEIGKYYESVDYISHSDTSKGFSNKIYQQARKVMLRKKRGLVEKITGLKTGRLLDIGSGTGHFANFMKEGGWQVSGIEINEKARNFAVSEFGLEIISPEKISTLETGSFDCITLWHVLEHFHDPFKYMSDISSLMKPGGLCLIALPNSDSYDAGHYREFWAAFDVPRHLWHFNPDSFRIFTEKTGFVLQGIRNLPLDVFYISILSEKYKGTKPAFLIGVLKAIPFAFLSVFNIRKSSSIIYLLRKKGK